MNAEVRGYPLMSAAVGDLRRLGGAGQGGSGGRPRQIRTGAKDRRWMGCVVGFSKGA